MVPFTREETKARSWSARGAWLAGDGMGLAHADR